MQINFPFEVGSKSLLQTPKHIFKRIIQFPSKNLKYITHIYNYDKNMSLRYMFAILFQVAYEKYIGTQNVINVVNEILLLFRKPFF